MIKIVKYQSMNAIPPRSMSSFVVISMVVLILAFVSAPGSNAIAAVAGLDAKKCSIWHGSDSTGKTQIGQRLNLRDIRMTEFRTLTGSDLSGAAMHVERKMPAFGKCLGEDRKQLLVAHIHESTRSSRLEKWLWQPVTAS